jgi:hypothetical protein
MLLLRLLSHCFFRESWTVRAAHALSSCWAQVPSRGGLTVSYFTFYSQPVVLLPSFLGRHLGDLGPAAPRDTVGGRPVSRLSRGQGSVVDPAGMPAVQQEVQAAVNAAAGRPVSMQPVERLAFYELARSAFAVVATGERRFWTASSSRRAPSRRCRPAHHHKAKKFSSGRTTMNDTYPRGLARPRLLATSETTIDD